MCPILNGYGVMGILNSRTRLRVNHVLRNQLAESCTQLVADFSQLQTVQFPLSRHLGGIREGGVGWYCYEHRAVHNRAAACVAAGGVIFENQL